MCAVAWVYPSFLQYLSGIVWHSGCVVILAAASAVRSRTAQTRQTGQGPTVTRIIAT